MRVTTTALLIAGLACAQQAPNQPGATWTDDQLREAVALSRAGRKLTPKSWPNGARVAVCLSFDTDTEAPDLRDGVTSPTTLSAADYGAESGVQRIIRMLDRLQVQHPVDLVWHLPGSSAASAAPAAPSSPSSRDVMPLAGQRTVVCARGARAEMAVQVSSGGAAADLVLHLQRRADNTDAACAALWPRHAGWHSLHAADGRLPSTRLYVYATTDWPLWQRALRRQASALYAARAPTTATPTPRHAPLPAGPAATLFTLAMLGLWWRERRV